MDTKNATELNANVPSPASPCSAVFDGQLLGHPMHMAIYNLMLEIEKLPSSEQQTKVVTMAGDLQNRVAEMRAVAATNTKMLSHYAEECFPEVMDGKKHFVRVLMESAAEDLEGAFNPPNAKLCDAGEETP